MRYMNQRGLTLIEILATVILCSIVGVLLWSIFFQGSTYTKNAVTNNSMLQEANIIILKLNRIHESTNVYQISSLEDSCGFKVTNVENTSDFDDFSSNQYCINITSVDGHVLTDPIITKKNVKLTLEIVERKNIAKRLEVPIALHRL